MYGAAANTNAGDTVYQMYPFSFLDISAYNTIYDTGGIDWLTADGYPLGFFFGSDTQIDLRPATLDFDPETSGGGRTYYLDFQDVPGVSGFTIAHGVEIENAAGARGDDTLIGNTLDNVLLGAGGKDLIFPGLGVDSIDGGDGLDEIAGTIAELDGDMLMSVTYNDRLIVYGLSFDASDVSVTAAAGQLKLVIDTGSVGERLEMDLDPGIGLPGGAYDFFTQTRGDDTFLIFSDGDYVPDAHPATTFVEPRATGFISEDDIPYYGVIETATDKDAYVLGIAP